MFVHPRRGRFVAEAVAQGGGAATLPLRQACGSDCGAALMGCAPVPLGRRWRQWPSSAARFAAPSRGAKVRAETERLGALALPQLAQEVMVRVYAPDGPGAGGSANYPDTLKPFDIKDYGIFSGVDKELRVPLEELVQEGMQQLMNSALVVVWLRSDLTGPRYRLTRAGRAALESDDTATRIAP